MLAANPLAGRSRPELAQDLRIFAVGNYVVFYQPLSDEEGIVLIRILSGFRDIDAMDF